jgi:uncharacterized alpha-E superfamily protein
MTSRIIDVQSTRLSATDPTGEIMAIQAQRWVSVLRSLAAHQMYRQTVRRTVNGADTLRFLLNDRHLPRSYLFCLNHLDECLQNMSDNEQPRAAVAALTEQLGVAELHVLAHDPAQLHEYLDDLQLGMLNVGAAISATYFPKQTPDPALQANPLKESE